MGETVAINTFDQVDQGDVYITYIPEDHFGRGRAWRVIGKGHKTDLGSAWTDHGNKTFDLEGDGRGWKSDPALQRAKTWASKRYGVRNWRKNGMEDWVDADKDYPPLRRELEAQERTRETNARRNERRRERRANRG